MKNFQPIAYISPTESVSAATFFRPVKANFDAITSTSASSGAELVGVNRTVTNYSQTGNSVKDHLDGIDTAIGTKQANITGAATSITSSDLTASRALISAANGKVDVSSVTSTELSYVANVTSAIQTQLNAKSPILNASFTGTTTVSAASFTTQAYFAGEVDNGNSSTAATINWTRGNKQKITLTGNCTFTFTAPTGPTAVQLRCIADGTVRTLTWPAAVKWPGGVAPTMTGTNGHWDIITLFYDGTNYSGARGADFY